MRDAAGSLALPLSLQDSLSQLIPGFSQAAAGGGGAALAAKLSVPFGVKALVAGLSVVAVGGTLAVDHPRSHRVQTVVRAPLHALVAKPAAAAQAAAPRVRYIPRTIQVAHITKPAAHQFHPVPTAVHSTDDTEHASAAPPIIRDENVSDAQQQQADDNRDSAEHAADAARDNQTD
jgi:hypothetical protein